MLKKSAIVSCALILIMTIAAVPATALDVADWTYSMYVSYGGTDYALSPGGSKTVSASTTSTVTPYYTIDCLTPDEDTAPAIKSGGGYLVINPRIYLLGNFSADYFSAEDFYRFFVGYYTTANGVTMKEFTSASSIEVKRTYPHDDPNGSAWKCTVFDIKVTLPVTAGTITRLGFNVNGGFAFNSSTVVYFEGTSVSILTEAEYQEQQAIKDQTDAITGAIGEQQQNEKDEANSQGNASADELAGAIPNDSQGFIDGMSSFISAMSYDGTEAIWQFPKLYLPEIPGVMDRVELTSQEYEIDFGYWVQKIPGEILEIIQIVLTIALIVYCFKELYGTISYVLTLKKDGGSE